MESYVLTMRTDSDPKNSRQSIPLVPMDRATLNKAPEIVQP